MPFPVTSELRCGKLGAVSTKLATLSIQYSTIDTLTWPLSQEGSIETPANNSEYFVQGSVAVYFEGVTRP